MLELEVFHRKVLHRLSKAICVAANLFFDILWSNRMLLNISRIEKCNQRNRCYRVVACLMLFFRLVRRTIHGVDADPPKGSDPFRQVHRIQKHLLLHLQFFSASINVCRTRSENLVVPRFNFNLHRICKLTKKHDLHPLKPGLEKKR